MHYRQALAEALPHLTVAREQLESARASLALAVEALDGVNTPTCRGIEKLEVTAATLELMAHRSLRRLEADALAAIPFTERRPPALVPPPVEDDDA